MIWDGGASAGQNDDDPPSIDTSLPNPFENIPVAKLFTIHTQPIYTLFHHQTLSGQGSINIKMWLKFNVSIKKPSEKFGGIGIKYYLCTRNPPHNGSLAEWLGAGLQNRLQQFESARNLSKPDFKSGFSFIVHIMSLGFRVSGFFRWAEGDVGA